MVQFNLLKWLFFFKKINYNSYYIFFKKYSFLFLNKNTLIGNSFVSSNYIYQLPAKIKKNRQSLFLNNKNYSYITSNFLQKIKINGCLAKNCIQLITTF